MKVSVIIPVYNEEDTLHQCLSSLEYQTRKPDEVIVVDNNSTDASVVIAKSFSFVTLIFEKRQGVAHARSAGFNYACGDLLLRVDADSILPVDWIEKVDRLFKNKDIAAFSGGCKYYGVSLAGVFNKIDYVLRNYIANKLKGNIFLWGSNMAVTKEAWTGVKDTLCYKQNLHEDYDLAIHLNKLGYKVAFRRDIYASVSSRRIDMNFVSFIRYVWKSPATYKFHEINVIQHMMPLVITCVLLYLPGRLLYRGYDEQLKRFSLVKVFGGKAYRIDPTTNVA